MMHDKREGHKQNEISDEIPDRYDTADTVIPQTCEIPSDRGKRNEIAHGGQVFGKRRTG